MSLNFPPGRDRASFQVKREFTRSWVGYKRQAISDREKQLKPKYEVLRMAQRKIIPYNPKLKPLAKALRKNMTFSEVLLWDELKNQQMLGYDFDRQRPIDQFIVDFYCKDLMLAIEIDGASHDHPEVQVNDDERQSQIESFGVQFLRFDDKEIKQDMPNVLRTIEQWIRDYEERNRK